MKNIKTALRRHHDRRLKKKRSSYASLSFAPSIQWKGRRFQTPCICSCWMCGNQRKHHGLKFQELKALEKATQELNELLSPLKNRG